MPLKPGASKSVVSENISELSHSGTPRPPKQRVAIALAEARKTGGKSPYVPSTKEDSDPFGMPDPKRHRYGR